MTSKSARIMLAALVALAAHPAMAKTKHHAAPVPSPRSAPTGRPFYPNDIEGGVEGNLAFNNQIRKHTDPLNANGGR